MFVFRIFPQISTKGIDIFNFGGGKSNTAMVTYLLSVIQHLLLSRDKKKNISTSLIFAALIKTVKIVAKESASAAI